MTVTSSVPKVRVPVKRQITPIAITMHYAHYRRPDVRSDEALLCPRNGEVAIITVTGSAEA